MKKKPAFRNLHLIISVIILLPVALAYGLSPNLTLPKLFGIKVETVNLVSIFRAMMGLYLAIITVWIFGIIKPRCWMMATLTNTAFMGGLALGRLISLAVDGFPSTFFLIGLLLEMALAFWGIKNLRQYPDLGFDK